MPSKIVKGKVVPLLHQIEVMAEFLRNAKLEERREIESDINVIKSQIKDFINNVPGNIILRL